MWRGDLAGGTAVSAWSQRVPCVRGRAVVGVGVGVRGRVVGQVKDMRWELGALLAVGWWWWEPLMGEVGARGPSQLLLLLWWVWVFCWWARGPEVGRRDPSSLVGGKRGGKHVF